MPLPPIPNPVKVSGDGKLTYVKVEVGLSTRPLPTPHTSHTEYSQLNFPREQNASQQPAGGRVDSPPNTSTSSLDYDIPPGGPIRREMPTGFSDTDDDDEEDMDLDLGPLPDSMRRAQILGKEVCSPVTQGGGVPPPLPHKSSGPRPGVDTAHPPAGAAPRLTDRAGGRRGDPYVDLDYDQPLPAVPGEAVYDLPPTMDEERQFSENMHTPLSLGRSAHRQSPPQQLANPLEVELLAMGYSSGDVKKALEVAPSDKALALMILERFGATLSR